MLQQTFNVVKEEPLIPESFKRFFIDRSIHKQMVITFKYTEKRMEKGYEGGHVGVKCIEQGIVQSYYRPKMEKQIKEYG